MKKYTFQNRLKICFISLLFFISNQAFSDPYYWGCTKGKFIVGQGFVCTEYGFKETTGLMDLCTGDTITLFARIPDGTTCTYQWWQSYEFKPGIIYSARIIGATNNKLFFSESFTGDRTYWCEMTCGGNPTVNTNIVTVRRNNAPEITSNGNLVSKNVCDKDIVTFKVEATGFNSNKWYMTPDGSNWSEITDVTSSVYTFTANLSDDGNQYKCYISNVCGNAESDIATLNVKELPDVNLGDDERICNGETVTLTAVSGSDLVAYQWNTVETTQAITVDETGTYSVTVTGTNSCQNSDTILVTVDPNLIPVNLGSDKKICFGDSVYLDAGTGYDHYNWSTNSNSQSVYIKVTGNYSVEVSNNNNVCRESDNIFIDVAKPFADEKICVVTIDSLTGKNLIVWEKTPGAGVVTYNIYRERNIGVYDKIGSVDVNSLSIFIDPTATPENRSYLYRITIVDTCGNESILAENPYHRPSFLQYVDADGGINLIWTDYYIQGIADIGEYLTSYIIYRGIDSTDLTEYQSVGSINNFTDTDPDALSRRYYYRVAGILKDLCNPTVGKKAGTGPYSQSMSNIEDNRLKTSVLDFVHSISLSVSPNPFNKSATLRFNNPDEYPYTLYIMDLSGKICRIVENLITNQYILEREDLKPGFYFVELRGPRIIRSKIVIE
jgi:3D (Asp-Asp-Asp) domain-containing protein